ncbi:Oligosaccharide translocation protein RFT1 [Fonsecaea pedrosoi]|nr:Oligosaccharide translocation protein RFT1 [Fonsecaea pedrosoi]
MSRVEASRQPGNGALLLILIQVASRAFTFFGNQFLLRFLSPSLLGIAVQLELVSVTSLYFARESLRVALQRPRVSAQSSNANSSEKQEQNAVGIETQTVVNLSHLAVLLGLGISTLFGLSYLRSASDEVLDSPYFEIAFRIYTVATLVELFAEPAFVVIQQKALYRDRARAETCAAMARCLAACIFAVVGHQEGVAPSILPFAVGQAAFAITILALYFLPTIKLLRAEHFSLILKRIHSPSSDQTYYFKLFHKTVLSLAATMYMQSIFKLLLTQGDALVMSFFSTLADQGAFALASNYGGLLARLVFQPVEESSRNTFGRLLSPCPPSSDKELASSASQNKSLPQANDNARRGLSYLYTTLHVYLLFSLPLISLAPEILPTVIPFVLSPQWRTPSTVVLLSTYCYYIPLMAVNGILDAFVTSVASPAQLRSQSLWMLVFTGVYGVAAWAMLRLWNLGSVGLVGANMVNMALRILWSLWFLRIWVTQREDESGQKRRAGAMLLKEAVPAKASIAVTLLVMLGLKVGAFFTATNAGKGSLDLQFLGIWTSSAVVLGSTILITEHQFLFELLESVVPQRLAAKIPNFLKPSPTKSTGKATR